MADGDTVNLPHYFKKKIPYDFKEYMDKELKCLSRNTCYGPGCVFWSRKDDEHERPPTLSEDILDFKKKIRDLLSTTLDKWPDDTLIQFWAPITTSEGRSFLTTQNQPFALNSNYYMAQLLKYRLISKDYKFYMDLDGESSGEEIGLLGRVFKHQFLESTPNVEYYSITEYPQRNDALHCKVRQSLAFPVFERSTQRCVGVLEVVTPMHCLESSNLIWDYYASNIKINEGFEKVGLECSTLFDHEDHEDSELDEDENEARTIASGEIEAVLRMVCEVHDLPVAQAWVSCKVGWPSRALGDAGLLGLIRQYSKVGYHSTFRMASRKLHLKKGVGVVGTALLSPKMVFCRDVTQFSLTDYPLAHYARLTGLSGCFAICLQSSCTGNDVYVLKSFMPVSNKASETPHTTLSKIWETIRENLRNFRFASGEELCGELRIEEIDNRGKVDSVQLPQTTTISLPQSEPLQSGGEMTNGINNGSSVVGTKRNNIAITCTEEEGTVKKSKREGNKAGVIEISLEDILQASKMKLKLKLKDAAEHLEDGKSTLKGACSGYGIKSWTPREINKVGCSQLNESASCVNSDHLPPTQASATIVDHQQIPQLNSDHLPPTRASATIVDDQQIPQLNSDHLPSTRASATIFHTMPHDTTMQDVNMVTIKAKYGEDTIIKFRLSLSSRLVELQEEVATRLSLEVGTYCVKYKDEDGHLILIASDVALQDCISESRLQGSTYVMVLLEPK